MNSLFRLTARSSHLPVVAAIASTLSLIPTHTWAAGADNTKTGTGALAADTTGNYDSAFGFDALLSNTTGAHNSATGAGALQNNTTGHENTADGFYALHANVTGTYNTAVGHQTLMRSTASFNTATGYEALMNNTTGHDNEANGYLALSANTTGYYNTATGDRALVENTTGFYNTANGESALNFTTTGYQNTGTGAASLYNNTDGFQNTADGFEALFNNHSGIDNTAVGYQALYNNNGGNNDAPYVGGSNVSIGFQSLYNETTGGLNVAVGVMALDNVTTGYENIAVGWLAGSNFTGGEDRNIDIGNKGVAGDSGVIRIGDDDEQATVYVARVRGSLISGTPVLVTDDGQLGVAGSSRRFKDDIKDIDQASKVLYSLRPVSYRYKHDIDPKGSAQFGLVAEEVEAVDPSLVVHDKEGQPYTVRYEQVNAMLLNEFLKEHARVEAQAKTLAVQQEEFAAAMGKIRELTASVEAQAAQLRRVSADLESIRPVPRVAANDGQ